MLPSSVLNPSSSRNAQHVRKRPASISPPPSSGDLGSQEREDGVMLTQHVFKEAERSRFFWQHKLSLEVKQVLEMTAETVHGLKSLQLQVQQLEEAWQKRVISSEGVPQLPPEMQHPPPRSTPRDNNIVDIDNHKQAMQEMLGDAMRRSSSTIADRIEELHERLDEVHLSHTQRLEDVLQDTANSRAQLEALLSIRNEEAMFVSQQSFAQQSAGGGPIVPSRKAQDVVPSQDPLVEFGKVAARPSHGNLEKKNSRKSAFESLSSINKLQLNRELAIGEDLDDEQGELDVLEVREESSVEQLLRYINRISLVVVLANAIFMGLTLDIAVTYWQRNETAPSWISAGEISFTAVYCVEMLLRLVLEKKLFFMGPSAGWNMFDTLIVLFNVFENLHSMKNASILRVFRILRVLKTARALRSMQSLRVCRVVMSLEVIVPLFWSCVMLVGFLYFCALIFTTFAGDFINSREQEVEKRRLLELYGSVTGTMKTIFSAVTGGEPWQDLSRPLGAISELVQALFFIVIFIMIFGVMNTVTAVYCDNLIYYSNMDRQSFDRRRDDKLHLKHLRSLLYQELAEVDAKIKRQNLMKVLKNKGAFVLKHLGLELWVAQALFRLLDAEDEGAIYVDEFVFGLFHLKGNAQNIHMASLEHQSKRIVTKVQWITALLEQNVVPQLAALSSENEAEQGSSGVSANASEGLDATQLSSGQHGRDSSHVEESVMKHVRTSAF